MCRCARPAPPLRHSSYRVAGEGSMSHFVVSFMKDVLGDNGRQVEICQRTVEIDAPSEGVATELAKQKFCKAERLCEWSLHADRICIFTYTETKAALGTSTLWAKATTRGPLT